LSQSDGGILPRVKRSETRGTKFISKKSAPEAGRRNPSHKPGKTQAQNKATDWGGTVKLNEQRELCLSVASSIEKPKR